MADEADNAQAHTEAELAALLASRRPPPRGRATCATCEEPISEQRQQLGARLCVDCQSEVEHHERVIGGRR